MRQTDTEPRRNEGTERQRRGCQLGRERKRKRKREREREDERERGREREKE